MAGIGPVSISTGSTPTVRWSTTRARARRPSASAVSRLARSTAEAPSETCDELPAVWRPSSLNAGLSSASPARDVSGRIPWSVVTVEPLTSTATISRSKRPSAAACAADCCEPTRERVALLARDPPRLRDQLGAETLRDEVVALEQLRWQNGAALAPRSPRSTTAARAPCARRRRRSRRRGRRRRSARPRS